MTPNLSEDTEAIMTTEQLRDLRGTTVLQLSPQISHFPVSLEANLSGRPLKPCFFSFIDRLSRCENDSLSAKNSASKPVRISSGSLQRKHMGLKGKSSSLVSASARNKTSREKTPGQKRNKESR